jgi:hypothetical protein
VGGNGLPLAAYRVDEDGLVRLWLDRRVYRVQMQQLIPIGVDAGRSVLDLVYAAWPAMTVDRPGRSVAITPGAAWKSAMLRVLVEDGSGQRQLRSEVVLQGEATHRVVDVWPADIAEGSRVVLVLHNPAGVLPAVVEQVVDPREAPKAAEGERAQAVPRPRAQPPSTRKSDAAPPRRAVGEAQATPSNPAKEAAPEGAAAVPAEGDATDPGEP